MGVKGRQYLELPPQTRGRRAVDALHGRFVGATPAGAGTTTDRQLLGAGARSYPRGREAD